MNNSLLYKLSAAEFAAWELHLYLDTHPHDRKAKELFREYVIKTEALRKEYENMYGPLSSATGYGKKWTKEPWPWQIPCCCGGED